MEEQHIPMLSSLVWPDRCPNPRSTAFEASMLTITPPMTLGSERGYLILSFIQRLFVVSSWGAYCLFVVSSTRVYCLFVVSSAVIFCLFVVSSSRVSAKDGSILPDARAISNAVFKAKSSETNGEGFNTLFSLNWGQFLDHDMVITPTYGGKCMTFFFVVSKARVMPNVLWQHYI